MGSMGLTLSQGHFFFFFKTSVVVMFILIFLLGTLTKSAHFPFRMWLPAAMAAPTPVSALVHSSTLVTAGIYVLFRLYFFFKKRVKSVLIYLALLTIFLGRLSAMVRFDSKKVVAFSTLRKLGLLGLRLGLGYIGVRLFHLITHGLRKALLFISVGKMMEEGNHEQDLRSYKKKIKKKMSVFFSRL